MKKPDSTDLISIFEQLKLTVTKDELEALWTELKKKAPLEGFSKNKKKIKDLTTDLVEKMALVRTEHS